MDRIIESISKIENDSVRIMEDAAAKKAEISAEINKETAAFDVELEAETKDRIRKLRASMEEDMERKLSCQKEDAGKVLASLEQHYATHRGAYVDELFRKMTGV